MHANLADEEIQTTGPYILNLDDELGCPFCGAPTELENRRCEACHHSLWIRKRTIDVPRHAYRFLLTAETILIPATLIFPALLFAYIDAYLDIGQRAQLIPAALGLGNSTLIAGTAINSLVPVALVRLSLVPPLLSALILLMVLSRWFRLYIPAAALSALRLVITLAITLLAFAGRIAPPSPDVAWAADVMQPVNDMFRAAIYLVSLAMTFASAYQITSLFGVQDHFSGQTYRRHLSVDRDVAGSSTSLWLRGREYAKMHAWAAAALHLRQSISLEPQLAPCKLLAVAYSNLGAHTPAMDMLEMAETLDRNMKLSPDPGIAPLRALITRQWQEASTNRQAALAKHALGILPANDTDEVVHADAAALALNRADFPHLDAMIKPDREHARQEILALLEKDETNITAWLWLSHVVDADRDREICLENVLTLDPYHIEAQEQLAALKQRRAYVNVHALEPAPPPPHWSMPATPAGEVLGEAYRKKHTQQEHAGSKSGDAAPAVQDPCSDE